MIYCLYIRLTVVICLKTTYVSVFIVTSTYTLNYLMVFTLFFSVIDEMHTPDKSSEKSEVSMHPELAKVGLGGRSL